MKNIKIFALIITVFASLPVYAEDNVFGSEEESIFETHNDQLNQNNKPTEAFSTFLKARLPDATSRNIIKAEKVFCYTVDYAPAGYSGYTIDELAVKGSCGELSAEGRDLLHEALLNNNAAFSNNKDRCNISPKIMFRFVYGLDNTDVLLSYPCYSLTFFQGRNVITVNAAPAAQIIEQLVNAYADLNEKFYSPALLGQMVANGQVMNQSQKEILRRHSPTEAPVKKWQKNEQNVQEQKQPVKSGWNKLK